MQFRSENHYRHSIRLKGYDYSQERAYFITICTQNRQCLYGKIIDGTVDQNAAGKMVKRWFNEIEHKFSPILCDIFICMPNHVHFILFNVGEDLCIHTTDNVCPTNNVYTANYDFPTKFKNTIITNKEIKDQKVESQNRI